MCWGHSVGKDPSKGKLDAFFDAYFERVESDSPTPLVLTWKSSVLPKVEWPADYLKPGNEKWRHLLFMVMGDRVMFPMGIIFPIPPTEPASFEFLRRFSTDAPFKMGASHFQVGIIGKNGKLAWRKPDAVIAAELEEILV
jgi:hypothetical protein